MAATSPGTLQDPWPSSRDLRRCLGTPLNKVSVLFRLSCQHQIPSLLILCVCDIGADRGQTSPSGSCGPRTSTSSSSALSLCQPPHRGDPPAVPRKNHKTQTAPSASVESVQQLRPWSSCAAGTFSLEHFLHNQLKSCLKLEKKSKIITKKYFEF